MAPFRRERIACAALERSSRFPVGKPVLTQRGPTESATGNQPIDRSVCSPWTFHEPAVILPDPGAESDTALLTEALGIDRFVAHIGGIDVAVDEPDTMQLSDESNRTWATRFRAEHRSIHGGSGLRCTT